MQDGQSGEPERDLKRTRVKQEMQSGPLEVQRRERLQRFLKGLDHINGTTIAEMRNIQADAEVRQFEVMERIMASRR